MAEDLPPDVQVFRDLQYGKHGDANKLDLYLPKNMQAKTPLIIWIHGGGWRQGSKDAWPAIALADKGYAVASINYRLSDEDKFPAQIDDCKTAVRWLRENAKQYNLDPDHFGAWGQSAGGHLAALLGTSSNSQEPKGFQVEHAGTGSRIQAVCDWCGPTDLKQFAKFGASQAGKPKDLPNQIVTELLGGSVERNNIQAEKANPITFVSDKSPPFLIMHGNSDKLVPLEQSKLLEQALRKAGAKVELHVLPGVGHEPFKGNTNMRLVEKFFDKALRNIDDDKKLGVDDKDTKPVATFRHQPGGGTASVIQLYPNGRLNLPDGMHTWKCEGNKLVLCWYDDRSPTGVWVDTCTLQKDGKSYYGHNQDGLPIHCEFVAGGDLRDVVAHRPDVDITPTGRQGENIRQMPLDAALGRATGARWSHFADGYSIAISGASPSGKKDAISQVTEIITKEIGSTAGLSSTENHIKVDESLAKKIANKFAVLQTADNVTSAHTAADFSQKFSGANGPLSQTNFERAKADMARLANLASNVPGLEKPEVKIDTNGIALNFKDQSQADRFSDMLVEARKRAGIEKGGIQFYIPEARRVVSVKYGDLNNLSEKEASAFFTKASDVFKEEKNKGKEQSRKVGSVDIPDSLLNLQATVDRIEQIFGGAKQQIPEASEGTQLASPRFVSQVMPLADKGSQKI